MRILIIKISSMGDIIHTLPALTDAVYNLPNISFDWVVERNFSEIPSWHPGVKLIFKVHIREWLNNWSNFFHWKNWKKHKKFILNLQNNYYDAVIDAQGLIKSAILITNFAKGKKHGMNYLSTKEPITNFFYDKKYKIQQNQHAIERTRQLFSQILHYPLPINMGNYNIKNYFDNKTDKKPYLIFLHSTSKKEKTWPKLYWRILIELANSENFHIKLPWYTKAELLRAQYLKQNSKTVEILPKLTLTKIAKQLNKATAIISIDTGLSHLSAALNKPNLTLYGPSNPKLIGNYGKNQKIIQSTTGLMRDILPEKVWKEFKKLLKYTQT